MQNAIASAFHFQFEPMALIWSEEVPARAVPFKAGIGAEAAGKKPLTPPPENYGADRI